MGSRHAIIIRLKYQDSQEFEWRLAYFQAVCLRSLLRQTDQNFDIVVLCNPIHDKRIKALSKKIKTIHYDVPISGDQDYERRGEKNSVMPFNFKLDYEIQTRLDSDDIISEGFTEIIHKEFKDKQKPHLLCFKPMRFDLNSLRLYYTYDNYKSSMFLSLFNPEKDTFIYEVGHGAWKRKIKTIGGDLSIIKFGYCYQSIHDMNASTAIRPKDVLV
jgi:hypothetical protein